jgi:signal peptidase II
VTVFRKSVLTAFITVFIVLFFDQFLKIWVKTHFCLGESYNVAGNWFIIHFTENRGAAFGMEFGGSFGKIFLTIIRLIASVAIGYYLYTLIKKKANIFLVIVISLILAGALGNIIDSMFYGLIFNKSQMYYMYPGCTPAHLFPASGGYDSFMFGQVVDMLYFPLFHIKWPGWMPFWGGKDFEFFEPVFNIADASITVGVLVLLFFQKRLFRKHDKPATSEVTAETQEKVQE